MAPFRCGHNDVPIDLPEFKIYKDHAYRIEFDGIVPDCVFIIRNGQYASFSELHCDTDPDLVLPALAGSSLSFGSDATQDSLKHDNSGLIPHTFGGCMCAVHTLMPVCDEVLRIILQRFNLALTYS
eukprot:3322318-Amphidinium_carterae.1